MSATRIPICAESVRPCAVAVTVAVKLPASERPDEILTARTAALSPSRATSRDSALPSPSLALNAISNLTGSPSWSVALTSMLSPMRSTPTCVCRGETCRTGGRSCRNTILSTAAEWWGDGDKAASRKYARAPTPPPAASPLPPTLRALAATSRHPMAEPLCEIVSVHDRPSEECCSTSTDDGPPASEALNEARMYPDALTAAMAVAKQPGAAPHPDETSAAERLGPAPCAARQLPAPSIIQEPAPDSNSSENGPVPFAPASSDGTVASPLRTIMLASWGCPPSSQSATKSSNEPATDDTLPRPLLPYRVSQMAAVALSTVSPPSLAGSCMSHRAEATLPGVLLMKPSPDVPSRTLHAAISRSIGWRRLA